MKWFVQENEVAFDVDICDALTGLKEDCLESQRKNRASTCLYTTSSSLPRQKISRLDGLAQNGIAW